MTFVNLIPLVGYLRHTLWSVEPMRKIICALLFSGVIVGFASPAEASERGGVTRTVSHHGHHARHHHNKRA
jgi:hypothetical protein